MVEEQQHSKKLKYSELELQILCVSLAPNSSWLLLLILLKTSGIVFLLLTAVIPVRATRKATLLS